MGCGGSNSFTPKCHGAIHTIAAAHNVPLPLVSKSVFFSVVCPVSNRTLSPQGLGEYLLNEQLWKIIHKNTSMTNTGEGIIGDFKMKV